MCGLQDYFDTLEAKLAEPPTLVSAVDIENQAERRACRAARTASRSRPSSSSSSCAACSTRTGSACPSRWPRPSRIDIEVHWSEKAGVQRVVTDSDAELIVGRESFALPYQVCLSELLFGAPLYRQRRLMAGRMLPYKPLLGDGGSSSKRRRGRGSDVRDRATHRRRRRRRSAASPTPTPATPRRPPHARRRHAPAPPPPTPAPARRRARSSSKRRPRNSGQPARIAVRISGSCLTTTAPSNRSGRPAGTTRGLHRTPDDPRPPQVLRARHVPLPVGRGPARRPLRGLHRDRHHHALEAHAGLQRAAPDGLGRLRPARRELRHQARHPPARSTTAAGDRQLPPPDRLGRLRLRLGARDQHHRSRVREVDAVDLPAAVQARPGLRGHRRRSTGARRARPASPTKRSARAAASAAARVVERKDMRQWMLRITALRRPAARGPGAARLARVDAGHAAQLDRPQRGRRGDVHARRRRSRGARSACSPRAPTRCTARRTWCWRPSIRWSPS